MIFPNTSFTYNVTARGRKCIVSYVNASRRQYQIGDGPDPTMSEQVLLTNNQDGLLLPSQRNVVIILIRKEEMVILSTLGVGFLYHFIWSEASLAVRTWSLCY